MTTEACEDFIKVIESGDVTQLINRAARIAARHAPEALQSIMGLGWVGYVTFSHASETACIYRLPAGFTISFNPDYLRKDLQNDLNFTYVLCHELAHLCLGHLEPEHWHWLTASDDEHGVSWRRAIRIVACEMQVSRFLHEIWNLTPPIEYQRVGRSLVGALSTTPEVLLNERWRIGDALSKILLRAVFSQRMTIANEQDARRAVGLADVYCRVWGAPSIDLTTLIRELRPFLPQEQVKAELPMDEFQIGVATWESDIRIRPGWELVTNGSDWRNRARSVFNRDEEVGSGGAGFSDQSFELEMPYPRDPVVYARILAALRCFFTERLVRRPAGSASLSDEKSPIACMVGRKELFWLSSGALPALYPRADDVVERSRMPLRVYVDVSGSTLEYWRTCMDALLEALRGRAIEIFQFSNSVERASPDRIRHRVMTTGGTDFNCVVEHALRNPSPPNTPMIVVTDGYATLDRTLCRQGRCAGLRVVLLLLRGLLDLDHDPGNARGGYRADREVMARTFGGMLGERDVLIV